MPKIVFSKTLEKAEWNSRLVRDDAVEEVRRLKEEADHDMDVGGPNLASTLIRHGLVDEYRPFVFPVILGGGTPFFPGTGGTPTNPRLVETRDAGLATRVVEETRAWGDRHGAAPLRPRPQPITDPGRLDHLDLRRHDRLARILHEYAHAA